MVKAIPRSAGVDCASVSLASAASEQSRSNSRFVCLAAVILGFALRAENGLAANFTTMISQALGQNLTAAIWDPGPVSPTPGNTYECLFNGIRFGGGATNSPANTRVRNPAVAGLQTFPGDSLTLNANTEFRAKGIGARLNIPGVNGNPGLILNGGVLDAGDDTIFDVLGRIQVTADSLITAADLGAGAVKPLRGFRFSTAFQGSGALILIQSATNLASVEVTSTSNSYAGTWIVKAGHLKGSAVGALGPSSILIDPYYSVSSALINPATQVLSNGPALFEVAYDMNSPGTLTLAKGGQMYLHAKCTFTGVVIGGTPLEIGTHPYSELADRFPDSFIGNGSGSIKVQPPGPPPAPASVAAANENGQVRLCWSLVDSAESYWVLSSTISGGPYATLANVTGGGYTNTGLVNGTTIYYVVQSTNSNGASTNSVEVIGQPGSPNTNPPANDAFETRAILESSTNVTVGAVATFLATKQLSEPDHAGNPGGRSIWWSWRAPASGTATIDTFDSSFDTLLAVYTGTSLSNLSLVASNDNAGVGKVTSRCAFNVVSNSVYAIVVDGANGANGCVILHINVNPDEFIISSEPRDDFAVTDNDVFSLLETNNVLYVAGGIRNFGRPKRAGALIRPSGELDPRLPRIVGWVFSVISDDEGGWYVGGQFTSVGNVPRTNLVHLFSDLSVDPLWKPDVNDAVIALALSEGTLYVSGNFTAVSGEIRYGLAALTASNAVPTEWNPFLIDPVVNAVKCMVVTSNSVYVGGWFWRVGSAYRENIAELDRITGLATAWNPGAAEDTGFGVTSLAVSETHVYVSGAFTQLGGEDRYYLGSIDRKTGLASSWNPSPDYFVWALALNCNTLYAGGAFTQIAGQSKTRLAAFDVGSGVLLDWDPGPIDNEIEFLALSGRTLYAGGFFTTIGAANRRYVAALDLESGRATDWAPPVSLPLYTLAVQSETVFAALFGQADYRRHVAAIDASTGEVLPWNADVRSKLRLEQPIRCMAMTGDTLYLGGSFTNVAGQTRNGLAAVDAATGALKEWDPNLGPSSNSVNAMKIVGNTLYIGGQFTSVGGLPRTNLAALDLSTGLATLWAPATDRSSVLALDVWGTNLFFSGDSITGLYLDLEITGVSLITGFATPFTTTLYDGSSRFYPEIPALITDGNSVFAGGNFYQVIGPPPSAIRNNLAALDLTTGSATAWNPNLDGTVLSLAKTSRSILAGGDFNHIGAAERNFVGEIETTTGRATDWHPQPNLWVKSIIARKNAYYVGGNFWTVNGRDCPGLAVFPPEGAPRITVQPDDALIPANDTLALKARVGGQEPLVYQWRRNGTNIVGATNAEFIVANAQPADSGAYDLRVTNGLGLVTSLEVIATVYEAPLITLQPMTQTALQGDTVTLMANATGSPTPRYQWRLNGANIPGATGPTLTFTNVQFTNGGSYSVAVANVGGGVVSDTALLLVQGAPVGFVDDFGDRPILTDSAGVLAGNNAAATVEPGEPLHARKPGGKSAWLSWVAPANGVATFSTRGSDFDTLLAIYTGTAFNDLEEVASDEDRGGFFTSAASFNAIGGTEYIIAVDGLVGASGNIVLSWSFDGSTVEFPRIIAQPLSRTVAKGDDSTFFVLINSPTSPAYQWFRGCNALAGETNSTLTIHNVHTADLGSYHVVVMNASTHVAQSDEAFLEIGPAAQTFTHDKFEDLLLTLGNGNFLLQSAKASRGAAASGGFIPVSAGSVGSQLFNNTGSSSQSGEPPICGVVGGASRWFGIYALTNGTLMLDTIGSKIDTFMAAFQGPDFAHLSLLACDDNGAPDHIRSRIIYPTVSGTPYFILADGVNGAQGDIQLNWQFGSVPVIKAAPIQRQGGNVILRASVTNSTSDTVFQWRQDGLDIVGGTNSVLTLIGGQSGTFSLMASNFGGVTTTTVASFVQLAASLEVVNGQLRFHLIAPASSSSFTIKVSSNLVDWVSIQTNGPTVAPTEYVESCDQTHRFYQISARP